MPNIQMGRNLPKVTEYVKNLGKSVAYSTVDYFKGSMEDTSDFIESNQELFKDIYSAARNYRDTMKAVDKSIRTSKVYEAGQALKKSLFESIRTGKFYDEKREQEYSEKAAGDMADFGDMDDWGSANDFDINVSDESFDQSDAGKSSSIVSGAIHDATEAQAGIIAKSTEYLAETHKASTKLLFAQGERLYATVNGGLANTQALLSRVNGFLEGPLTTHMENSTKFYQEITGKMNEVTAMMKESLEMQRNLYKKEQKSYEGSQYYKVGSNPDLKEYSQQVFKNFKEFLGPEVGMLLGDDMGEGSNMLMALVANPLRFIPDYLVRIMVPATIKKSLEILDKSFSGLFANMIARFNKWGSDTSDAPEILKAIGRIFGLRTDSKSTIDTSNYEKGAVPFDGVTKKAITQVIPGYLARIESALTTREERLFDYESGKWMNVSEVEKRYKNRKQRTISDAAYDTSDEIREYYAQLLKKSKAEAEKFQKNVQQVYKKIYEDYGAFEPYRAHGFGDEKQDPWDYYAGTTGMSKEEFLDIARMIVGTAGAIDPVTGKRIKGTRKRNAMGLAAAMLDARESQARWYRDIEARGLSPIIQLAAGAYKNIDMNSDELARTATGQRANLSGINNMIVDATDKYNKNIFYYLRGMYAELMAIRQSGLGGGKGRGRKRGGPTGPVTDPRTALEKALATEVDAEAARVAAQNISDQQSENGFNADNFAENWRLEAERRLKEKQDQDKKKGLFGRIMSDDEEEASDKGFLESLLQAGSLGAKFKVITQNINKLMAKPGLAIAGIIDTADRRLFQLVFGSKEGEEITDKEGRSVKGFLEYMVMRTRETFDNLNDWLDENILEPLKKKLGVNSLGEFFKKLGDRFGITDKWNSFRDKYVRPVGQRLKEKFGWGWGQVKGSLNRTYGQAWRRFNHTDKYRDNEGNMVYGDIDPHVAAQIEQLVESGEMTPAEASKQAQFMDDYADAIEMQTGVRLKAHGGLVTRRGLAVISPGERIVPIGGKVTQRNNLAAEKAFAKRYGLRGANYFAGGNTIDSGIPDLDRDKVVDTTKTVINEVMGDTKHKGIANVIASGLIGGGVSLVTGLVGGPLLGAAVGSAFGIAQNSQTVQEWLFGKEIVNQETGEKERSGGVISKDFQEKFKKYFPGIRDFGIAGAVAGLFTPFGLVGGLVAGSAFGFAKQTDTFQEWLFGKADENGERDGGLLKKEFRDKVKKAAPRMAIGAVGGALLGPFGILGNAVLGSALGYVTTTDKFRDFVFGKPDSDGKRKGGLVGAMYDGLLKPALTTGKKFIEDFSEFVKKRVFKPIDEFMHPFGQMIKNMVIGIGDFFKDKLADMAENTIGRPIKDFLQHSVFKGVLTWTKRLLFLPVTAAKGLVSAPFAALGFIGKNMTMGQIRRGTALNMTAAQRNQFRYDHPLRWGAIGRQDIFSKTDRILESMTGEDGAKQMQEMKSLVDEYLDTRRTVSKKAADKVKEAGIILSDYLNETSYRDDTTKTLYQVNKSGDVKKIHKAIAEGNMTKVSTLIYRLNIADDQAEELIAKLAPLVDQIAEYRSQEKDIGKHQRDLQAKLSAKTGGALRNTKNIRRFSRMLNNELDYREAELAEQRAKDETPEAQAAESVNTTIRAKADEIIEVFKEANRYLRKMSGEEEPAEETAETETAAPDRVAQATSKYDNGGYNSIYGMGNISNRGLGKNYANGGKYGAVDDLLFGNKKDITTAASNSLHTIEFDNGVQGIVNNKGAVQNTSSVSQVKEAMREQEQDKKERKSFREKLHDSLFGKVAGGLLRGLAGGLSWAKEGIFGKIGEMTNKFGTFFDIIKWVFIGGTAIAATGHATGWFQDTVWPFLKKNVGPWLIGTKNEEGILIGGLRGLIFGNKTGEGGTYEDGLISGIFNTFRDWFEESPIFAFFKGIGETYQNAGGGASGIFAVVGSLMDPIVQWYKTGYVKVFDNIVEPLVTAIVSRLPQLLLSIGKGIAKGIMSWFNGDKDTGLMNVDEDTGKMSLNPWSSGTGYEDRAVGSSTQNAKKGIFSQTTTNTIARDSTTGNTIWMNNATGEQAIAIPDANGNLTYQYADGTVETDPNASFTLLKNKEYGRYENKNTFAGMLASGAANNLLAGLTNYNIGKATTLGNFKSVFKGVPVLGKIPILGKVINLGGRIGKGLWNTTNSLGKAARGLGGSIRNFLGLDKTDDAARAAASTVAGTADDVAASATSKASGGFLSKIKSFFSKNSADAATAATSGGYTSVYNAADDAAATATKVMDAAVNVADDSAGLLSTMKKGIVDFISKLGEKGPVKSLLKGCAKIFGTTIDDAMIALGFKKAGEQFAKKAGESVAKSALKSVANALSVIPVVTVVLAVGYFISGWNDAHTIFGIVNDIEIPMVYNVVAGLVNAVKNALPGIGIILSFVPTSTIIDIFTDTILPFFGWDNSNLEKMRTESEEIIDTHNATANAEDMVESVEEYNNKVNPTFLTKIGNTVKAIGGTVVSTVGGAVSGVAKGIGNVASSIANFFTGGNKDTSGKSRHLYQNSAALASKRFGTGTIGRDGCGPVAAANLMNRLQEIGYGREPNLDSAIDMATGYQDASGGTSMDYFTDILASKGYGSMQTSSKDALLRSIAGGNPAVLLGNSGKESGTPFGANNHYINALGLDKSGQNMIVEDPDLPQSTVKYPVKDVMNDTISGVATTGRMRGWGRNDLSKFFAIRKRRNQLSGRAKTNMVTVSKMAARIAPILYTGESGGSYSAVNANDNGAVSIGLIQWHGCRAHDILSAIVNELGQEESVRILGDSLYNMIVNKTRSQWDHVAFTKNSAEVTKLKALLETEESKKIQNAKIMIDIDGYINSIKAKGIKDENAIAFICHIYNAYGHLPDKFFTKAKQLAGGSAANITLDHIYNACLADSYYNEHYGVNGYAKRVYNAIVNSQTVGEGTTEIDAGSLTLNTAATATSVAQAASVDSTSTDGSLTSIITQLGYTVVKSIFGEDILNLLGISSDGTTTGTGVSGGLSTGGTGVNISVADNAPVSEKQNALVSAMSQIQGKIPYSLNWPQDPEKGQASCASTVAWAYNKVLGFRPGGDGYASSTAQAKDSKFTDIYVNNGGGDVDLSILKPGDIMYMNWDRTSNNGSMQHTEMYAGDGVDWSHGGNPHYGPVQKSLDSYRKKHLMKVRRYNEFMSGQSRKRRLFTGGHARTDASTISKANSAIQKYGIDNRLINSPPTDENAIYAQYFAAMVTLLSVIADNTEALSSLQASLAQRGVSVSTETIQAAAGNARKRMSGKSRNATPKMPISSRMNGGYVDTGDVTDMQNILNSPTGDILRVMEALATE